MFSALEWPLWNSVWIEHLLCTKGAIPAIASCYTLTMSTCTPSAFLATTHCTLAMRCHSALVEWSTQSNYFALHPKCNSVQQLVALEQCVAKVYFIPSATFYNTPSATLATRSLHRSVTATHRMRAMPRKWTTVKKWDEASLTSGTRLLVKLVNNYNPSIMMVFYTGQAYCSILMVLLHQQACVRLSFFASRTQWKKWHYDLFSRVAATKMVNCPRFYIDTSR